MAVLNLQALRQLTSETGSQRATVQEGTLAFLQAAGQPQ